MAYINQVKRHNLHLRLDLPANAPEGHPHIIDLEAINENDLPDDLKAVDVIATVLYKWDPEALQNLLDLSKEDFHFGHLTASQYETYIIRNGRYVRVRKLRHIGIRRANRRLGRLVRLKRTNI